MAMMNSEIRAFAWERLWKGRWFWKLLSVALFMKLCEKVAFTFLGDIFAGLGADDWTTFATAFIQNWQDQTTPIPALTREYILRASGATALEIFFAFILAGIASYAAAVVLLKCLRNDQNRWFADTLAGFKTPFGLFGLAFVRSLIGFVWVGLLGLLPASGLFYLAYPRLESFASSPTLADGALSVGLLMAIFSWVIFCALVPFYRYRFLYLIKAQNPEYSVGECFRANREWIKGRAMESFRLDWSYWKMITLEIVIALGLAVLGAFEAYALNTGSMQVLGAILSLPIFVLLLAYVAIGTILVYYISVGQGKFYLDHE